MWNPLRLLFKKESASVLGIDIGTSSIKLVQIKKKGSRAILETYGALALGPYGQVEVGRATNLPFQKIVEALNDVLREAHTTTRRAGVALPFRSSLLSVMEMPDLSPKQLSVMIPIEARKYIPVPISEVSLDWSIIPKEESRYYDESAGEKAPPSKVEVLVVAIHNDTISNYQDIINQAELDVSFFEIEIFSAMRSVLDQTALPVLIFDMGAATTKLYILERGAVKVSHIINRGSQDITLSVSQALGVSVEKAESYKRNFGQNGEKIDAQVLQIASLVLEYIFSEANGIMLGFQRKYNKNISKAILIGGGVALKGFKDMARTGLEMEAVIGDPFGKIEAPAFLTDVLKKTGPEFGVAVGVALRRLQELE